MNKHSPQDIHGAKYYDKIEISQMYIFPILYRT